MTLLTIIFAVLVVATIVGTITDFKLGGTQRIVPRNFEE